MGCCHTASQHVGFRWFIVVRRAFLSVIRSRREHSITGHKRILLLFPVNADFYHKKKMWGISRCIFPFNLSQFILSNYNQRFNVWHMATSGIGRTPINQSWMHRYKVLLIACMAADEWMPTLGDGLCDSLCCIWDLLYWWSIAPMGYKLYRTSLLITLVLLQGIPSVVPYTGMHQYVGSVFTCRSTWGECEAGVQCWYAITYSLTEHGICGQVRCASRGKK